MEKDKPSKLHFPVINKLIHKLPNMYKMNMQDTEPQSIKPFNMTNFIRTKELKILDYYKRNMSNISSTDNSPNNISSVAHYNNRDIIRARNLRKKTQKNMNAKLLKKVNMSGKHTKLQINLQTSQPAK